MLTQKRLKELLSYDPDTGQFIWLVSRPPVKAGAVAGHAIVGMGGRRIIGIDNESYSAARLAFLYMEGEWPECVDHINRVKSDDRWCNLRNGSVADNNRNMPVPWHKTVAPPPRPCHNAGGTTRCPLIVNR